MLWPHCKMIWQPTRYSQGADTIRGLVSLLNFFVEGLDLVHAQLRQRNTGDYI